jgi:O-Antigen ligase
MSTVPLAPPGSRPGGVIVTRPRTARAPVALAGALLAIMLYAAFAHGAVSTSTDARIQVAVAVVAVIAGAVGLWSGALSFSAPRLAIAGVCLLAAFAAWSGVTVLWSVAPDQTWIELNRAITYVIVLCLAIALGASDPRAVRWIAYGFLGVALAVTAYALGQKLLPGLHVSGVFTLNQNGPLPRLQEPFGYWNALALFIAMGVPSALAIAVDWTLARDRRLGALITVELMLLVIGLTYSRGGMIALAIGLAAGIGLSAARLRSLAWLGLACLALIAPLAFGLSNHALTTANVSLGARERSGLWLLVIVLVSSAALILAAHKLFELEATVRIGPERTRAIGRLLIGMVGALAVAGVLAVAFSSRGLTGTISHEWNKFTTTRATSVYQPDRLLSVDSENRWVWWKEAAGAFSARPIAGWGAGSFPVVHLLYRRDTLSVNQPHSVPLQFLAETGAVGAILALAGFGLLLAAAVRAVRRLPPGAERLLWAALLAGGVAYAVHSLYDWDWNIPGITFPALAFLGVLAGASRRREADGGSVPARPGARLSAFGLGVRLVGIATVTLCLCLFALSVVLPSLAASKASTAVVEAASASPAAIARAQSAARVAGRLDPLSDAGPRVEATIAVRQGNLRAAVADLLDAVKREPSDGQAWEELGFVYFALHEQQDGLLAFERQLALDPHAQGAAGVASDIGAARSLLVTPPDDSRTAHPLGR